MTVHNNRPVGGALPPTVNELAARGAKAIKKMDTPTQDAIMEAVPGRADKIGHSLHSRLLGRDSAALRKMIGDTHLDTTTETTGRVAALKEAMSDEDVRGIATALKAIATNSGLTPGVFERLVNSLELLNEVTANKELAMVPGPTRMKIESLAKGDAANLPRILGETIALLAYEPLRKAVDTPPD